MIDEVLLLGIVVYLLGGLFFGDKFYFWGLRYFGKRKLKKLGFKLEDLEFSFEQIDYLVATPSISYQFSNPKKIYVKKVKKSIFWPQIYALQVVFDFPSGEEEILAIVDKDRFPVPLLDALIYHNQINEQEYNLLVSYLFSHSRTHRLILEEVKRRVMEGQNFESKMEVS